MLVYSDLAHLWLEYLLICVKHLALARCRSTD